MEPWKDFDTTQVGAAGALQSLAPIRATPMLAICQHFASLLAATPPMASGGLPRLFGHGAGPTVIALVITVMLVGTLQRGGVLMIEILR